MAEQDKITIPAIKTSWKDAFQSIRESRYSDLNIQFVLKSGVEGIPPGFQEVDKETFPRTYREIGIDDGLVIQDLGIAYAVGADRESGLGLFSPTIKAIGALGLLYLAYRVINSATNSTSPDAETTGFPQLAHAANRLEQKQYNIFISHSWRYDDHYGRIVDFLDEVPSLEWQNHSVPSTDPLPQTTDDVLKEELRKQIRSASVVIVSGGMYGAYSDWINIELDIADELDKPVIAIIPEGQEKIPAKIQENSTEIVGWRKASLINALAKHG